MNPHMNLMPASSSLFCISAGCAAYHHPYPRLLWDLKYHRPMTMTNAALATMMAQMTGIRRPWHACWVFIAFVSQLAEVVHQGRALHMTQVTLPLVLACYGHGQICFILNTRQHLLSRVLPKASRSR